MRTNFYEKNYVGWPPVLVTEYANPNSFHWHREAEQMCFICRSLLGEKWGQLVDEKYPGEEEPANWKELYEFAREVYLAEREHAQEVYRKEVRHGAED